MSTRRQTDAWINFLLVGFSLTILASVGGVMAFLLLNQTVPSLLPALGVVAAAGLVNLLTNPLNR